MSFSGSDFFSFFLSYFPGFRTKTEKEMDQVPRSLVIKSLKDFVGNIEEQLLPCSVRALSCFFKRMKSMLPHPRNLFLLLGFLPKPLH